jgi:hypothetical protein
MHCAGCGSRTGESFRTGFAGDVRRDCVDASRCLKCGFRPRIGEMAVLGGVPNSGLAAACTVRVVDRERRRVFGWGLRGTFGAIVEMRLGV